ncbi:MAG TPA: carboxypeptidase-like regulatory domain-containing protein [Terriglobia bacterium]|nr:carboxypeptidase-like regulatory domain-containing protein [Terriglobia bacterium]
MGRYQETAIDLTHRIAFLPLIFFLASVRSFAQADSLKLVVTAEQQVLAAPFPARVTLHLHNSGDKTLWLYRPVTAFRPGTGEKESEAQPGVSGRASPSIEGSTLAVRLEGADNGATASGQGEILDTVGMPHPVLLRLAPGDDDEEKTEIRLLPAQTGTMQAPHPLWGKYKFTVTYAAKYSNGDDLDRILGVALWQGEVESNTVVLDVRPPPVTSAGTITGTVTNPDNVPLDGILASLSDREEHLMNQTITDVQGKFSFSQLPPGLYWVTVRRRDATEDTAIFRHVVLTPAEPAGTVDFLLTPPETFEPKQLLHKPVLIEVVDGSGAPLANVGLEITWSNGTILDSVKGSTASDGMVPLELIPGANYATLKRRGCPKDDERINVAEGPGIDGFKMELDCSKK